MANHGIFIPRQIGAMNVDIWNRHAISGSVVGDVDNGSVFQLTGKSSEIDEFEVWTTALTSASPVNDVLWMAYSGEDFMPSLQPATSADDIKEFTNLQGKVFPAYRPQVHDLITLNADAILTTYADGDLYLVPVTGEKKMDWASTPAASGLCYKYIQDITIPFGSTSLNSSFASGREAAYIFECISA